MIHKTVPIVPERISLKILMHPEAASETKISVAKPLPQPLQKSLQPVPQPKVPQVLPQPKKPPLEQSTITALPQKSIPTAVPATPKASEAIPAVAVKASAPVAQKSQETYEEENLGRIRTILMERLTYPKNALRLKQQGEATVTFTLETTREVSQITISKSSGFELLDDAARNLIQSSAGEFPKPSKSVRISVPIAYKLR